MYSVTPHPMSELLQAVKKVIIHVTDEMLEKSREDDESERGYSAARSLGGYYKIANKFKRLTTRVITFNSSSPKTFCATNPPENWYI